MLSANSAKKTGLWLRLGSQPSLLPWATQWASVVWTPREKRAFLHDWPKLKNAIWTWWFFNWFLKTHGAKSFWHHVSWCFPLEKSSSNGLKQNDGIPRGMRREWLCATPETIFLRCCCLIWRMRTLAWTNMLWAAKVTARSWVLWNLGWRATLAPAPCSCIFPVLASWVFYFWIRIWLGTNSKFVVQVSRFFWDMKLIYESVSHDLQTGVIW